MTALEAALVALAGAMVAANWAERNQWAPPAIAKAVRWLWSHRPGRQQSKLLQQLVTNCSSLKTTVERIESRLHGTHRTVQVLMKMQRLQEELMGLATLLTDDKGQVIWANQHYLNLVGASLEEVLNAGWKNVIPQEQQAMVIGAWRHSVEDRRDFRMRYSLCHSVTGECVPVMGTAHVVTDEHTSEVIGWVAHVRPLNERQSDQPPPAE